jgi:hypothetical protein
MPVQQRVIVTCDGYNSLVLEADPGTDTEMLESEIPPPPRRFDSRLIAAYLYLCLCLCVVCS